VERGPIDNERHCKLRSASLKVGTYLEREIELKIRNMMT